VADSKRDNAAKPEISLWCMGYTLTRTRHEVWQLRFANGDIRLLQKWDIRQLITWSKFASVVKNRTVKACRATKIKFQAFSDLRSRWKSPVTIRLRLPSSLWESRRNTFNTKPCESYRSHWEEKNVEILNGVLRSGWIRFQTQRVFVKFWCKILTYLFVWPEMTVIWKPNWCWHQEKNYRQKHKRDVWIFSYGNNVKSKSDSLSEIFGRNKSFQIVIGLDKNNFISVLFQTRGSLVKITLCSGGTRFAFRPEYWLSWLRFYVVLSNLLFTVIQSFNPV
jgi:hypothetical protein